MKKIIISFVCPSCKEKMEKSREEKENNDVLICRKCNAIYKNNDGIYNFLPKNIAEFKEQEATFHSDIVESYHDTAQLDARRNKHAHDNFLIPLLNLQKDAMILELGCGLGQDGRILMKNKLFVVQSDISPKTLEKARQEALSEGLDNSLFVQMDSENIPFADNTFDAIFMVASLHHMMDPEKAIQEMKRCTKEGGLIVVGIEPNKWQYFVIFPFIRFHKKYIKKSLHYSPGDESTFGFNRSDFRKTARMFDLKIVRISPVWYVNGIMHVGLEAIYRVLKLKKRIKLSAMIEKIIEKIDNGISKIPIIKNYPWHWNVVMQKENKNKVLLITAKTGKTGVGRYVEILRCAMSNFCNFTLISPTYFLSYPIKIKEEKSRQGEQKKQIIHFTNQQLAFPLYLMNKEQRKRSIVTVHDVIPMQYPLFEQAAHLRWKGGDQFFFKKSLQAIAKAEMVICVSNATKNAFLAHVNYPEEKVKVIYEYPAQEFKDKKIMRSQYDILYVGSEMPHKNIGVLLKAIALIKKEVKDIRFIKVGRSQWPGAREALMKQARELGIEDSIVWYDEVNDLSNIYNSVALVVHPSLHEGFGFPVVEAMACGCPVLCSSRDSLPELGGDAAVYFNPENEQELAEKIVMILKSKDIQEQMRNKGLQQVKKFNKKIFEEQMVSLYNSIGNEILCDKNGKRKNSKIVGKSS